VTKSKKAQQGSISSGLINSVITYSGIIFKLFFKLLLWQKKTGIKAWVNREILRRKKGKVVGSKLRAPGARNKKKKIRNTTAAASKKNNGAITEAIDKS
jgi:hypothetical protein